MTESELVDTLEKNVSTIELRLPSRLGYEKVAMNTAASVAKLMGFADERVEDLKTAVAEACINAMEHGNKLDETLSVSVILSMDAHSLEVKVLDTGSGPKGTKAAPDIDRKMQGEEDARGMGMFLIRALVDEAEWVSSPSAGSYARMVIHLKRTDAQDQTTQAIEERATMQEQGTQVKMEEVSCGTGPITVLRFAGDITSTSQAAVLGTYQGLPESVKRILLDFSRVEYLNSSGIALIIQMMIAASKRGQTIQTFGLTAHFQKVFTMVGITKYTTLHPDETTACAAFTT
ncbi:anti-anti-sigma factor [Edaphobacter aggregans]|uniref:Anti-anti-sigma factor n=1 Tax=Edaphobacter aggregans TaxID=570835 RepID=A0A3R9PCJ3_9BACT|nr:ATP-binding protein [Edaphobacter aggregans]RSL18677.1 anti-anti-sigma factor [Edaphobacter aggregans]